MRQSVEDFFAELGVTLQDADNSDLPELSPRELLLEIEALKRRVEYLEAARIPQPGDWTVT